MSKYSLRAIEMATSDNVMCSSTDFVGAYVSSDTVPDFAYRVPRYLSEPQPDKPEYMYVCKACGSEWHDSKTRNGTCGNCGGGAYRNKTKVEVRVEDIFGDAVNEPITKDDMPMEYTDVPDEVGDIVAERPSFWRRILGR